MIHRDLKPESIFVLSGRGREKIKLLGFGNSQLKEVLVGNQFRTSPETVIGTFQYLSPEQALGRCGEEVDGRADLYSLGVILYEMLTRELPFRATQASDLMIAHIQGTPIPIRVAHADLAIPDILTRHGDALPAKGPRGTSAQRPRLHSRGRNTWKKKSKKAEDKVTPARTTSEIREPSHAGSSLRRSRGRHSAEFCGGPSPHRHAPRHRSGPGTLKPLER